MYKSLYHGTDLTRLADRSASFDILKKQIIEKKNIKIETTEDRYALHILISALSSGLLGSSAPIITDTDLASVTPYLDQIIRKEIRNPRLAGCIEQLKSMNVVVNDYTPIPAYQNIKGIRIRMGSIIVPIYNHDYAEKVLGLKFNDAHKDGYIYG